MALKIVALGISTLGYLAFLVSVANVRILLAPLVWACTVTIVVYTFGIAGHLALGANAALLLGIALGLYAALRARGSHPALSLSWLWTIPFALPFVLAWFAIPNDFVFLVWDEVGTWAKTQKLVYDTNALLTAESPITIKSYPPGQIIFQYYLTRMTWWTEKQVLFAQTVFVFSALLATAGALITRKSLALIVYLTLIPVIYYFHFDYTTIYSDPLLAVVFAACLAQALRGREHIRDDVVLAVCLVGFVLLKDMAVVFVALVLAVYALNIAFVGSAQAQNSTRIRARQLLTAMLICGTGVAIMLLSWKWYVSTIESVKTAFAPMSLASFAQEPFKARFGQTATNFVYHLIKPDYFTSNAPAGTFGISLVQLLLGLTLAGLATTVLAAQWRRAFAFLATLSVFAGAVGYLLFLFWLYIVFFTEYEGVRLASFDRYSMTFFLAWTLTAYTLLVAESSRFSSRWARLLPVTGLVLVFLFAPTKFYADTARIQTDQASLEKMKKAKALALEVKKHVKPKDRVYFLAQNSNGYERHLFDYAMVPFPHSECWSVGKKYNDGDVWTCDRPFGLLVKDYDYLAIYHADDRFWNDNRDIFSPEGRDRETGVYRITRQANGTLLLSPAR